MQAMSIRGNTVDEPLFEQSLSTAARRIPLHAQQAARRQLGQDALLL